MAKQNNGKPAAPEKTVTSTKRRKDVVREAQQAREQKNRDLRSKGQLTPWEKAKAARFARRHPAASSGPSES